MKKVMLFWGLLLLPAFLFADSADPQDHQTWEVTANSYQYSMTVTTALVFDLVESRDVNDKIAAFVGNDCRGVAQPITYVPEDDRFLAHLLVYSNEVSGDTVKLYMYDDSESEIIEIARPVAFASNATYGSVDDPYLSRTSYNITFFVNDEGTAIPDASVFLDGYGTGVTDESGEITYFDVFPSDSIYYRIEGDGYETYSNSLSLIYGDLQRDVNLSREAYDVYFSITNGEIPVENAKVELEGYGLKKSNVNGTLVFTDVIVEDSIEYHVSGTHFYSYEGMVHVVDQDVSKKVVMTRTSYNVNIDLAERNQAVENAEVTLVTNGDARVYDFIENEMPQEFSTEGNAQWHIEDTVSFQGEYSLCSGKIFDNQVSRMEFTKYVREGELKFYLRVSSEHENDYLSFFINGEEMGKWSGEREWQCQSFDVEEGEHKFEWVYQKDGSSYSGNDCAWIDYLVIPAEDSVVSVKTSDENGRAVFYNMDPEKKVSYSVYSEDHELCKGFLDTFSGDTTIALELTPVYTLHFSVFSDELSGNIAVENAQVWLPGLSRRDTTDRYGDAYFSRVSAIDELFYSITADGYRQIEGTLSISNMDVQEDVVIELLPQLEAANLISPNSDGINDFWEIYNVDRYRKFRIRIFSTAGELLYETKDYENNKWDGTREGTRLPDGIYYYVITNPDESMLFRGIINLIN